MSEQLQSALFELEWPDDWAYAFDKSSNVHSFFKDSEEAVGAFQITAVHPSGQTFNAVQEQRAHEGSVIIEINEYLAVYWESSKLERKFINWVLGEGGVTLHLTYGYIVNDPIDEELEQVKMMMDTLFINHP